MHVRVSVSGKKHLKLKRSFKNLTEFYQQDYCTDLVLEAVFGLHKSFYTYGDMNLAVFEQY